MKHLILAVSMLLAAQWTPAQELKTYSGLYYGGQATYTYYENGNGERVKHGQFTFDDGSSTHYTINYTNGVKHGAFKYKNGNDKVSGQYKNDLKDGEWTYETETNDGNYYKNDLIYLTTADSVDNYYDTYIINYSNGIMDGTITCTRNDKTEKLQMSNGRIVGEYHISYNDHDLTGQFDDEGFPDGTWTDSYVSYMGNNETKTRTYVHGLLLSEVTRNESTGEIDKEETQFQTPTGEVKNKYFLTVYDPERNLSIVNGMEYSLEEENGSITTFCPLEEYLYNIVNDIEARTTRNKTYMSGQEKWDGIPIKTITMCYDRYDKAKDKDEVYGHVDQMPTFQGGHQTLTEFISRELRYPVEASIKGIEGMVVVQFIVETDGSVGDVQVNRSPDPSLSEEAIRVIKCTSGKWKPGMASGRPVRIWISFPIRFKL